MPIKKVFHNLKIVSSKIKNKFKKIVEEILDSEQEVVSNSPVVTPISSKKEEPEATLDLEPIESFLEEYIGKIIVELVDVRNIDNLGFEKVKVISSVYIEGEFCKFELSNINGQGLSYLTIIPSKFGTFVEKDTEANYEGNSMYRILFYGGFCLEYLDPKGLGKMTYQE